MSQENKYWRGVEELEKDPNFVAQSQNEFSEKVPVEDFLGKSDLASTSTSRRDFLKFLGFSTAAATLAACEAPVTKAIPYVVKPEEITPGVANWYASTYMDGVDYCSVLVKTREGRPIHIEGNKNSAVTGGGVNARVNASVLSLYDSTRIQKPSIAGQEVSWDDLDKELSNKFSGIASRGGNIRILTSSIVSPSTKAVISKFASKYGSGGEEKEAPEVSTKSANVKHVSYDTLSASGMVKANKSDFGKAAVPTYSFDKAKTIVSIGADFMSTWMSSIEYANQYAKRRNPAGDWMSRHYQFEATLSLSGTNADIRAAVKPSEYGKVALHLYNAVAKKVGGSTVQVGELSDDNKVVEKINKAAADLLKSKGASLVVSDSNDEATQSIVNAINTLLGNYGKTLDIDNASDIRQADDSEVYGLVNEMKSGKVDALLVLGVNPAYSLPADWNFAEGAGKVKVSVSFAQRMDETASACTYIAPDHHFLESWNDANLREGHFSLVQPVISPLFKTRQAQSSLLTWAGEDADYNAFIKASWKETLYPTSGVGSFAKFWNKSLHDGVYVVKSSDATESSQYVGDVKQAAASINKANVSGIELALYFKTAIGDGNQLRNPWLHETPDPVTKVVWDNYICMNPADMKEQGFNTNLQQEIPADVASLAVNGKTITLPVVPVPGQKRGVVAVALGYGQEKVQIDGAPIGVNAYNLLGYKNGNFQYGVGEVEVSKTGETYAVAGTQTHHTMMGRKMVNETDLATFKSESRETWNPSTDLADSYGNKRPLANLNLWNDHDIKKGHRWGLSIDLNTCIGCSACVTACYSENNVPVVGKDEVRRNREMNWMRIDRYYSSDKDPVQHKLIDASMQDYLDMEDPSVYPDKIVHQPVMCQHCNHASCETVCPVAATTHSNEGLNQMAYNRCVGTRYCANNCPYKVRRFNWFNYYRDEKFTGVNPAQDDLGRMVLNPDVVVRSRGVMEKCSMCVQRIQAGKLQAKKNGAPVQDGDIQTACSSACPTNAITFGDHNDSSTKIAKETADDRAYHLLEEVGNQPNIWYQTKVRNTDVKTVYAAPAEGGHGESHDTHESEDKAHS